MSSITDEDAAIIESYLDDNYSLTYSKGYKKRGKGVLFSMKGKFECTLCDKSWTSLKTTLKFWIIRGNEEFNVEVFGQKCLDCNNDYVTPELYQDEIERLAEFMSKLIRDVKKKGRGKKKEAAMESPHESQYCQACALGICSKSK